MAIEAEIRGIRSRRGGEAGASEPRSVDLFDAEHTVGLMQHLEAFLALADDAALEVGVFEQVDGGV